MPYHGNGHIMLNSSELKWGPIASMAPGARIALIGGNRSKDYHSTYTFLQFKAIFDFSAS
jgi:hypothetical protein